MAVSFVSVAFRIGQCRDDEHTLNWQLARWQHSWLTTTYFTLTFSMSNIKPSLEILKKIVYHIFLPPKIPQEALEDEREQELDTELCHLIVGALAVYRRQGDSDNAEWACVDKMLKNLTQTVNAPSDIGIRLQQLAKMQALGESSLLSTRVALTREISQIY